ncbi:MAG: chorismate synthase, partial [Bacteroidetes bacterium]|nr:chorismate synthase [Bacteroidota bacterium]
MGGNSFGTLFKITTFGESHGKGIGVVIDGCPANMNLNLDQIQEELNKRKPGQSAITTARKEQDTFDILSGLFEGKTTGAPLTIFIKNQDSRSEDYNMLKDVYRPSHADYTYELKYGWRDHRGGGRSSARETAARVAAGAVAKQILEKEGIEVIAFTKQIGHISLQENIEKLDFSIRNRNEVKCPDLEIAEQMSSLIKKCKSEGDSIGGVVSCVVKKCPVGLGEPVFDRLDADIAYALMNINAVKGVEIGDGFKVISQRGSEHRDEIRKDKGFLSNHAGGVLGGISSGQDIIAHCAFKPTSSITTPGKTINESGEDVDIITKG